MERAKKAKATTVRARRVKDDDFASVIEAKRAKLHEAMKDTRIADLNVEEPPDLRIAGTPCDRFEIGKLQYLDRNRVR